MRYLPAMRAKHQLCLIAALLLHGCLGGAVSTWHVTVTPEEGGTLTTSGLVLTFPPGAVDMATLVTVRRVLDPNSVDGVAYEMQPDGLTFKQPVAVTFSYSTSQLTGADGIAVGFPISRATDGSAEILGDVTTIVDFTQNTVTSSGTTAHFSTISDAEVGVLPVQDSSDVSQCTVQVSTGAASDSSNGVTITVTGDSPGATIICGGGMCGGSSITFPKVVACPGVEETEFVNMKMAVCTRPWPTAMRDLPNVSFGSNPDRVSKDVCEGQLAAFQTSSDLIKSEITPGYFNNLACEDGCTASISVGATTCSCEGSGPETYAVFQAVCRAPVTYTCSQPTTTTGDGTTTCTHDNSIFAYTKNNVAYSPAPGDPTFDINRVDFTYTLSTGTIAATLTHDDAIPTQVPNGLSYYRTGLSWKGVDNGSTAEGWLNFAGSGVNAALACGTGFTSLNPDNPGGQTTCTTTLNDNVVTMSTTVPANMTDLQIQSGDSVFQGADSYGFGESTYSPCP